MTTVRVLLVTSDREYSGRLGQYMSSRHTDIKLSIIDSPKNIGQMLTMNSFSVILVDAEFEEYELSLPGRVICAYLSSADTQDMLNDRRVFCKYRSGETLYRNILDLFAEVSSTSAVLETSGAVFAFAGAGGGVGTSTAAVAYAKRLAASGARTLYVNFDKFFDGSAMLSGETIGNMSDLIFAAISAERNRGSINLGAKAKALMCTDASGVCFIAGSSNPFDMNDLNEERVKAIYDAMAGDPPFDAVVLDVQPQNDVMWELMLAKAGRIFIITENDPLASGKLGRMLELLRAYESHSGGVLGRVSVIVNRDKQGGKPREMRDGIPYLGSIPRYKDNDPQGIMSAMARLDLWDR